MANQIKIKRSAVEGKVPLVTDLELGELAINTYDGKLFVRRNDGVSDYIREIGGNRGFEVKNQTGSTISKGTAVGFAGTVGSSGKLLIQPFLANGATDSQYFMGIVENDIVSGGDGYVISHGKIFNLNTSQWAQGDVIYVSSSITGGLTNTQPPAPNNKIIVAAVINSSTTAGVLEVRVTLGSSLGNDELVELGTLANGDTLVYNSTSGRFENAQPPAGGGGITADQTVVLTNKTISYNSNNLTGVQPTLVSGTNIKTINGTSILGSGDISISGGVGSSISNVFVSSTSQLASKDTRYIIVSTTPATISMPVLPAQGDVVYILVANNLSSNIIARNGEPIMGIEEDMIIDNNIASFGLIYAGSTLGWRLL